jgi:uncharacterized caspase-like protein
MIFEMDCGTETADPWAPYANWQDDATTVRRQWMTLLGFDAVEIEEHCQEGHDLDLAEEQSQLEAAKRLSRQ